MPFFDYECDGCGNKWEEMHSVFYKLERCPKCDSREVHKLISSPSMFNLKGDGFYCNDYKKG